MQWYCKVISQFCFRSVFESWKKTALLFFYALAFVAGKNKCAVCAVGFFSSNVDI